MTQKVITQILRGSPDKPEQETFSLMWGLTSWCNYRCPYCIQPYHSKEKPTESQLVERARKINQLLLRREKSNIDLSLLGGEITFYDLKNILNEFSCGISKLVLITNFSQTLDYFKDLYLFCETKNILLHLMCSYHEVGPKFFNKYLALVKWCVETGQPLPILSFVYGNDFDLSIFTDFPDLPYYLIHFNIKQLADGSIEKLDEKHYSVWKEIHSKKFGEEHNKLISESRARLKNKELWWANKPWGGGYTVKYLDGSTEHVFDIKDILTTNPEFIYSKIKYCNASQVGMFIEDSGQIFVCSSNLTLLGNIDDLDFKEYLSKLNNVSLKSCPVSPCPLCHNVNIYNNSMELLRELMKKKED